MSSAQPLAVLLWVAFAVLVAAVLWIVLAACDLAWPDGRPMLALCPAGVGTRAADPALAAEEERQRALQGSVRDLEIALLDRPYCAAQEPEPPSIEDAIRQGDEQALAGCWVLTSDYTLYDVRTGEPRGVQDWEVCFADDGSGRQTLGLVDGTRCEGRVTADFPDATTLTIRDAHDMQCRGGDWSYIRSRAITCELGSNGTSRCLSRDVAIPDGGTSSVTMRRKV